MFSETIFEKGVINHVCAFSLDIKETVCVKHSVLSLSCYDVAGKKKALEIKRTCHLQEIKQSFFDY